MRFAVVPVCLLVLSALGVARAAESGDAADCEIFLEGRDILVGWPGRHEKLLLAFSRRDGRSFAGVAWPVPPRSGKFPVAVALDTTAVQFDGQRLHGTAVLNMQGVPRHTLEFSAERRGRRLQGTVKASAGGKTGTARISGSVLPPTPSRDAPYTDPADVPVDRPWGEIIDVPHPYMLWTREEAAALRQRIENDPAAKRQLELTAARCRDDGKTYMNLFRYLVLGDQAAGGIEKRYLLSFIGSHPNNFYTGIGGGRHFDNYLHALRYDVLYDELTPEQREQIETTFRGFLKHHIWEDYRRRYTRTNWLPNMQWPRPMAAHLMAVALRDKEALRRVFHSVGGWKWYLDEYIADGRFYMEEFGKQYSMMGEMLLWCRGVERLGLNRYGYGYTGRGGATMRRYMNGLFDIALPAQFDAQGRATVRHIHMGDAGPSFLAQRSRRGRDYWTHANMNGRDHQRSLVAKMMVRLWMEVAHAKWPDGHFDYPLALVREPGQDTYYPTLLFGLKPIDAADAVPPVAPSTLARERGFALLRAEEGRPYWSSPKPAVALQFGMYYVHYVHDCFSLMEVFFANRPIYAKRQFGPHRGYRGGHPWRDHVRGHNGVVVDNLQIQPVDDGNDGCAHQRIRHQFAPPVKFVAVRAAPYEQVRHDGTRVQKALYPDATLERALFLTDDYLCDVFSVVSDRPRLIQWNVHPIGKPALQAPESWAPTDVFDGGKLWEGSKYEGKTKSGRFDLANVRTRDPGDSAWVFPVRQEDGVGVDIHMLGEPGTTLYHDAGKRATTLIVERRTPATTFAALHAFARDGDSAVTSVERLAQTAEAVAVRVSGPAGEDRLLVQLGEAPQASVELTGGAERYRFGSHAFVRVTASHVDVWGDIHGLQVPVATEDVRLRINGLPQESQVADNVLRFSRAE